MPDLMAEMNRLADLTTAILYETGEFIHAMPYCADFLDRRAHAADARNPHGRHRPVKPQTAAFLDKSRELLAEADTMLAVGLNEAAGRTAYLAGLHAAPVPMRPA